MIKIARFNETQEYSKKFDDNWLDINKTIEKIIDIDKGVNYERDELILLPMEELEETLTIVKIIDIDKEENYERDELILLPMEDLEKILDELSK